MKKKLSLVLILVLTFSSLIFADDFLPTAQPVVLPEGTDGSYGTEGTYVLFGDWPQTIKAEDITVSSETEEINNWECYKGSDGFYYVQIIAEPEYDDYKFSNGNLIEYGEKYFFKLEPIKWRILTDNYQGGKLLVAENILANVEFSDLDYSSDYSYYYSYNYESDSYDNENNSNNYKHSHNNNYEYSTIRSYLNEPNYYGDGFINNAFTTEAIENINTVTVDNSAESTIDSCNNLEKANYYYDYTCKNTKDKIFLLSVKEVTNDSYGFNSNDYEYDTARRRKTTDYSRATGANSGTSQEYKDNGYYWLRTPTYFSSKSARLVSFDGDADSNYYVLSPSNGIVPALSISF